jgi:hypothetical protein
MLKVKLDILVIPALIDYLLSLLQDEGIYRSILLLTLNGVALNN